MIGQQHRTAAALGLALTLSGCAVTTAMTDYLKEEYEAAGKRDSNQVVLAKQVAATRSHLTATTNLDTLQGTYGGMTADGCHRVSVRHVQHKNTTQYRVCGDRVLDLFEPAPALPPARELDAVRDGVSRAAWSSGQPASAPAGAYRVEAVPIGPGDGQGCRRIEERVTSGAHIIEIRQRRVCP